MWKTCGLMWISFKKRWKTFFDFLRNVDMWISAKSYPHVFHIGKARWHIGLIELYTFIHAPTTTTKFKFKFKNSSILR